jgi:hypothetical protein
LSHSGTNQWGPYTANDGTAEYPNYALPVGTATPSATANLDPPQSPSGSVTNESATFNVAETITSTEEFLTDVLVVDSAQQGSSAVNAACSFNSLNPAIFQTFRWE